VSLRLPASSIGSTRPLGDPPDPPLPDVDPPDPPDPPPEEVELPDDALAELDELGSPEGASTPAPQA
jgi:hypothetical protein